MSGLEIERKYLVRNDADFKSQAVAVHHICQGYIPTEGATVRIRLCDDEAFLTIKSKSTDDGLTRYEFETPIKSEDALQLMKLCKGGLIDKHRYIVPYEGHRFEIDVFHAHNEGLVIAEVELERADEPVALPPYIGPEVTGDKHYYNSHMLTNPYSVWKSTVPEEYR